MERLIVGVLGKFKYTPIKIKIESGTYEEKILSVALEKYYKSVGEYAQLLLFTPESLITLIDDNKGDAYEKIKKDEFKDFMVERIRESLGIDPQVVVIPSLGKYSGKEYSIDFHASPQLIRAIMLLTLIKESKKYEEVILDISIGHNLYVSILQDVLRDLIVNKKLREIFKNKNFKVKIAEIPPVVGSPKDNVFPLYFRKYTVKVFFEFPLKENPPDLGKYTNYSLLRDDDELKKKNEIIKEKIANYRKAFRAIKLNTPLVLVDKVLDIELDNSLLSESLDMFSKIIKKIQENKRVDMVDNEIGISYLNIDADRMRNMLHAAALSDAIYDAYTNLIKNCENTTDSILNIFEEIYKRLGLEMNSTFLERDIRSINAAKDRVPSEWKELKEILMGKRIQEEGSSQRGFMGDIKRNFFAHSGFLGEFVLVKKDGERIYLKYKERHKGERIYNTIKSWLG